MLINFLAKCFSSTTYMFMQNMKLKPAANELSLAQRLEAGEILILLIILNLKSKKSAYQRLPGNVTLMIPSCQCSQPRNTVHYFYLSFLHLVFAMIKQARYMLVISALYSHLCTFWTDAGCTEKIISPQTFLY